MIILLKTTRERNKLILMKDIKKSFIFVYRGARVISVNIQLNKQTNKQTNKKNVFFHQSFVRKEVV